MKKHLQEIPKGALSAVGTAIGVWLIAGALWVAKWAFGLSLSDKTVSAIQLSLVLFGLGLAGYVGWHLYFRAKQKLLELEGQIQVSTEEKEEVCVVECIKFRRGKITQNRWSPFCPKCDKPAFESNEWVVCSAQCGWGVPTHERLSSIISKL